MSSATTRTVFIADDVEPLRALIRAVLTAEEGIDVVGEADNGFATLAGVIRHRPDVLLLDLSMPGMDGFEVLHELRDKAPNTKVVVLSGFRRDRMAPLAYALGAVEYLEKGIEPERLRRVVRDVCFSLAGSRPGMKPAHG